MPGGILRKSWNLNNCGALQQARGGLRLAQVSTRGAAQLGDGTTGSWLMGW